MVRLPYLVNFSYPNLITNKYRIRFMGRNGVEDVLRVWEYLAERGGGNSTLCQCFYIIWRYMGLSGIGKWRILQMRCSIICMVWPIPYFSTNLICNTKIEMLRDIAHQKNLKSYLTSEPVRMCGVGAGCSCISTSIWHQPDSVKILPHAPLFPHFCARSPTLVHVAC